jgi:hypothetical protein
MKRNHPPNGPSAGAVAGKADESREPVVRERDDRGAPARTFCPSVGHRDAA